MGTNCAPLVDDLFIFCYERDFMMSLSADKHATFNSRYLDNNNYNNNNFKRITYLVCMPV